MARHKQKKKASTPSPARFYRRIGSKGWSDSNYFTYSAISPAYRRWLAAGLGATPRDILSIGCGNGELESHLAASGHRLVGIDLSHPMLRRAVRAGLDRPVEADARFLPFAAASFDVVLFPESIGHLPLAEVFVEARRVLRSHGALIVATYSSHTGVHPLYRKYRFAELTPAAEAVGLTVEAELFLAARRNTVAEAPSDAKATLLYLKASVMVAEAAR
ncbi:MAG TPA: class I SAM-dependent methyltransferase [Stellaceae bacterium]